MNKEQLIQEIIDTGNADARFLYNELNGIDLMMDAVEKSVKKMNKQQLEKLHSEAKESQWFQGEKK